MDAQRRINLELLVKQQECYDEQGKIIPKKVDEFAYLARSHHDAGYNTLKYDLKIRQMQNEIHR